MLCVPVWDKGKIVYQSVPLSYRMWRKKESKLELAASMVRQVMPELTGKKNVIVLCGSWYTKSSLVSVLDEYLNLGLAGNARYGSVLYGLAPQPTGRRGRPAKQWNIEASYYGQKTFWPLCSYMVRSRKGIELLVNLINIAYCAMKLLPYQDEAFTKYRNESVQDFRFALSEQIRQGVFFATFMKKSESMIKSSVLMRTLKYLVQQKGYHL